MKTFFLITVLILTVNTQSFCQTPEGYLAQGHTFLARNKLLQAEGQYLLALELDPLFGEAHQQLGEVYLKRQHYPAAIIHYKAALSLQNNHPTTYLHLAFCQQKNGSIDRAIITYLSLIKLHPELPEAYLGLGGLYDIQGFKEKAEDAYTNYRALKR